MAISFPHSHLHSDKRPSLLPLHSAGIRHFCPSPDSLSHRFRSFPAALLLSSVLSLSFQLPVSLESLCWRSTVLVGVWASEGEDVFWTADEGWGCLSKRCWALLWELLCSSHWHPQRHCTLVDVCREDLFGRKWQQVLCSGKKGFEEICFQFALQYSTYDQMLGEE